MSELSKDAKIIKGRIMDLLERTKTYPYSSPLGSLHAAGIKAGEEIALGSILVLIELMEDKCPKSSGI